MKFLCQKDKKWAELKIGKTDYSLGRFGCFVVALASLLDREPPEILAILNENNCFDDQGRLLSDRAAMALGMAYKGKAKVAPDYICVAETAFYAPKFPQHFFVWMPDGTIMDPLDGQAKKNPYPIVSYRLFRVKEAKNVPAIPRQDSHEEILGFVEEPPLEVELAKESWWEGLWYKILFLLKLRK